MRLSSIFKGLLTFVFVGVATIWAILYAAVTN